MVEINLNISGVKISKNRLNAQHIRQRFTDGVCVCACVYTYIYVLFERVPLYSVYLSCLKHKDSEKLRLGV